MNSFLQTQESSRIILGLIQLMCEEIVGLVTFYLPFILLHSSVAYFSLL